MRADRTAYPLSRFWESFMHAHAILVLVLAASFSGQPTTQKAAPPVADAWAGWWTVLSNDTLTTVEIEKKTDGYHLRMSPYETQTFKETAPGVLECKNLGVIRRGKLSFAGLPGETLVLKAEFCYAVFLLFYVGPPN
jgi:hypothetical protein